MTGDDGRAGHGPQSTDIAATPRLAPVDAGERLESMDLIRGVALFGILVVNMLFFALPLGHMFDPAALVDAPFADRLSAGITKLLFEQKFISLFSLLFGAGLAIQFTRAASHGRSGVGLALRRLAGLALFGLLHVTLLWMGDILFVYACCGTLLAILLAFRPSARVLLIIGVAVALAGTLIMSCFAILSLAFGGHDAFAARTPDAGGAEEVRRGLDAIRAAGWNPASPIYAEAEALAMREGPFLDALAFRLVAWGTFLLIMPISYGWRILAMFVLGAAMVKAGMFSPDRCRRARRRLLMIALPAGLALSAADVLAQPWALGTMTTLMVTVPIADVAAYGIAFGIAALLGIVAERPATSRVRVAVQRAGRMALTVYLAESLLVCALVLHWGFGLHGMIPRAYFIPIASGIWLLLVLVANLWLSRFRMGPLEWLWRTMTYLRPPAAGVRGAPGTGAAA